MVANYTRVCNYYRNRYRGIFPSKVDHISFSVLQKEVIAAIIAAAGTVIVSVVSITVGKYYEKKLLIERQLRLKKIPIYHEFIEFWFRLLMSEKLTGKKISEKEMLNFTNKFTQEILGLCQVFSVKMTSGFKKKVYHFTTYHCCQA